MSVAADRTPPLPGGTLAGRSDRVINARTLWAGGVATALVAALIAIVGIVIARGIFDVPVLAPTRSGTWGNANTAVYAVAAFAFGLVATGLIHLLLRYTPSPFLFFGWILGLCTLVGALAPFATSAELDAEVATAIINAVIGLGVWSLTVGTARRSIVPATPPGRLGYRPTTPYGR